MSIRTTLVPDTLLDVHLKDLKSTETKVLLVIIHQAFGSDVNNAMQCKWISGSQLRNKTGSSRRAISSAIEMLIRKGLIEVIDRQGNILREPVRRKGKTNLFFRLSPLLLTAQNTE